MYVRARERLLASRRFRGYNKSVKKSTPFFLPSYSSSSHPRQEVQIYYYNFFAMFLFFMAAALMFFVILFVVAEHLMILKGGESFDSLNKCSLASSLLCGICAIIACVLLSTGLSKIHPDVSIANVLWRLVFSAPSAP